MKKKSKRKRKKGKREKRKRMKQTEMKIKRRKKRKRKRRKWKMGEASIQAPSNIWGIIYTNNFKRKWKRQRQETSCSLQRKGSK